jgi:putative tricarboxylic transport membrane protein
MLVFGEIAFLMEENGFPVAPAILGMVLGNMLEENFVTPMIKSDGNLMMFFSRPIAGGLAAAAIVILLWPVVVWLFRPRVQPHRGARPLLRLRSRFNQPLASHDGAVIE